MPRFTEAVQKLILNLWSFFQEEKTIGSPIDFTNVTSRVSRALNISETAVTRIRSQGIIADQEYKNNLHGKISATKKKIDEDTFSHALREVIYKMYAEKKYVTLDTISRRITEEFGDDYCFSKSFVYKRLKKIGFKWKRSDNRKMLMEQPHIILQRTKFLREYVKNMHSANPLVPVFLDETWIFSKGSFRKSWQDGTLATCSKKTSEGCRYVVVHAGGEEGFVSNASLVFKCSRSTGDYHDNMNRENFEKWFKEKFIPNLKYKSLIVMDNASYHSGLEQQNPSRSWTKKRLIAWLREKGILYPEMAMKDQIWNIASRHRNMKKIYHLDEYVKQFGHQILRLPPYHCHFNAIEMVWSECKRQYDKLIPNASTASEEAVLKTWHQVLRGVSCTHWQSYVHHVEKLIKTAWEKQQVIDVGDLVPIIINVSGDSTSDSTFGFSSDNSDEL